MFYTSLSAPNQTDSGACYVESIRQTFYRLYFWQIQAISFTAITHSTIFVLWIKAMGWSDKFFNNNCENTLKTFCCLDRFHGREYSWNYGSPMRSSAHFPFSVQLLNLIRCPSADDSKSTSICDLLLAFPFFSAAPFNNSSSTQYQPHSSLWINDENSFWFITKMKS